MVLIGESELLLSYTQNLVNDATAVSLPAGAPPIVRIQGNCRGTTGSGSTLTITLTQAPAAGNLLVLVFGSSNYNTGAPSLTSISQTGASWAKQVGQQFTFYNSFNGTNDYGDCEIWAGVVSTGASTTVTVTFSNTNNTGTVADVCEYYGLLTSGFLDKTASNSDGSGNNSSGTTGTTAATTQANELWVGGMLAWMNANQSAPTNSFTLLDGSYYENTSVAYLEHIVSSKGTASSGTTFGAAAPCSGCIATFIASSQSAIYTTPQTMKTYTGSIPQNELMLYNLTLTNPNSSSSTGNELIIKLNGTAVYGTGLNGVSGGGLTVPANGSISLSGMLYAPSGAFTLTISGLSGVVSVSLSATQLGLCNFNDLAIQYGAYSSALTVSTTQRMTPLGNLTQTMLYVRACSADANSVQFENPGDDFTYGVQIAVDSVQQSWNERYQGSGSGTEASAMLMMPLTVGSGITHTLTITKRNSGTNVYLSLVATCPWILPPSTTASYFPVTSFNFTPGCTFYGTVEPLHTNSNTMFIGVGKTRSITFGPSTDYYASQSGTGILQLSFQFNYVDVVNSILVAYGFGGCLAYVGVDTV